jgi:hypothetical protein
MRLLGGARIVALAVVASTALSACVSAPVSERPALRVLPGGAGVGSPPSPAPSISARPEPPIGVIMSGRVVIACDMGTRCTYFARLVPLRTESPDPTSPPDRVGIASSVTLVGANAEPRGFGPTARVGRPADQEPAGSRLLTPGLWHIDAWTTTLGLQPTEFELPTPTRLSCALDFELPPGHTLSLNLAHGATGCSIHLTGALIP